MRQPGGFPSAVVAGFCNSPKLPMKIKYYSAALIVLILDYATKRWALAALAPAHGIDIIPGYLGLSYVQNTGVAFGLFDSMESFWKPYILAALAILAIVGIIFYGRQIASERKLLHLALAVTTGGILGNLADRIFRGYVIDFVEFHIKDIFYWPNFNVADSAITIGIALLLIDTIIYPNTAEMKNQSAGDDRL
jgi:signal peptidase II